VIETADCVLISIGVYEKRKQILLVTGDVLWVTVKFLGTKCQVRVIGVTGLSHFFNILLTLMLCMLLRNFVNHVLLMLC
jgi:hypothetical protein